MMLQLPDGGVAGKKQDLPPKNFDLMNAGKERKGKRGRGKGGMEGEARVESGGKGKECLSGEA